jgi:hypothetical protein
MSTQTIRERLRPAKWQASVVNVPASKSASNEVYKRRGGSADHVVTTKVGKELLVIYLNNYNKGAV